MILYDHYYFFLYSQFVCLKNWNMENENDRTLGVEWKKHKQTCRKNRRRSLEKAKNI